MLPEGLAAVPMAPGAPTSQEPARPTPAANDEIDAFNDQARWLLEWHNKRNDGFSARSVALLGFTGVILALLPRGLDLDDRIEVTAGIRVALIATAALLLCAAAFCLLVLAPHRTTAPSIQQLREHWRDYADGKTVPRPQAQMAERLLHGRSVQATSPIDLAFQEANRRGRWFTFAVIFLGAALLTLTALVIQVIWQV